jgi:Ca2+-binding EF-hand superfamily protein
MPTHKEVEDTFRYLDKDCLGYINGSQFLLLLQLLGYVVTSDDWTTFKNTIRRAYPGDRLTLSICKTLLLGMVESNLPHPSVNVMTESMSTLLDVLKGASRDHGDATTHVKLSELVHILKHGNDKLTNQEVGALLKAIGVPPPSMEIEGFENEDITIDYKQLASKLLEMNRR